MTILGICFDSSAVGAAHSHDPGLVILSFLIAALASYCSLDMAERLSASAAPVAVVPSADDAAAVAVLNSELDDLLGGLDTFTDKKENAA